MAAVICIGGRKNGERVSSDFNWMLFQESKMSPETNLLLADFIVFVGQTETIARATGKLGDRIVTVSLDLI